jgi:hypothetical protein
MTRVNIQAAEQSSELNSKLGSIFTAVALALAGFLAFATFTAV